MSKRKRKPLAKRLMALLVIGAMLFPAAMPAHAAPEETVASAPKIRVIATLVDGGQYLEVGLNIDSKGDGADQTENGFQSAGVLLRYAPTVLTPVTWGETAAAVNVPMLGTGEPVILPSKGADELSGKLAEAIQVDGQGYLFLSAESARSTTLNQALPEEAAKEEPATSSTEQTPGGYPILRIKQAETAAAQAVVVRFRVNDKTPAGEGTEAEKYSLSELAAALDLAGTTEADIKALAQFPLVDDGGLTYIADNRTVNTSGIGAEASLSFVWIENGVTANAGTGGNTEDFITLTLFDWDNTLIGTKIISKLDNAAEQETLVQAAFDEIQIDYADIFTSHAGYDFGCWIPYDSTTPTTYGVRVQSGNTNLLAVDSTDVPDMARQLNEPADKLTAGNVTKSMTVKAVYVANKVNLSVGDITAREYTVIPVNYDRYGTAGIVSITVEIRRQNGNGTPVPRPAEPALRVAMTATNGVTTYNLYSLTGADVEQVEIVPFATTTGGVASITWSVVDTYGITNWANEAGSRLNLLNSTYLRGDTTTESMDGSNRQVLKKKNQTFLYECYLGWINSLCEQQDPSDSSLSGLSTINAVQLRAIGISTLGAGNVTQIRQKIYQTWWLKNSTDGVRNEVFQDLTKREITDALGTTEESIFSDGE